MSSVGAGAPNGSSRVAPTVWAAVDDRELLDLLPTGLIVIDGAADVRFANRTIIDLLGWPATGYEGRSLLELVVPDDLEYAADVIAEGHAYPGRIMGPIRLRYVDGRGEHRVGHLWARELPDRSGYLLVAPEESAEELLGVAVRGVAMGAPLDEVLPLIVDSCLAHPIMAPACLLGFDQGTLRPLTDWPLDETDLIARRATPWELAGRSGVAVEVADVDVLDPEVRAALARFGTAAVWCRPVVDRNGESRAVLVVFRQAGNPPSANQRRWLTDIVSVAALAVDQHDHRTSLEHAAFTDSLTGVASRARLHARIAAGVDAASVFYIDLDGFKEVNDHRGHVVGDALLAAAAERIAAGVGTGDLVVRLGGDEFVVLGIPRDRAAAERVAADLVESLAAPYELADPTHGVTIGVVAPATIGVGFQAPGRPFDEALLAADEALAAAKRAGKRRYRLADRSGAPTSRAD